ncbi:MULTISPECIES: hypothetical protein [Burkholderia cepacia complex]|uniref:Scaffold protein FimL second domain-containing protein n=1 Tax=Burkholderia orbicola (strain AU 1054) TaxID=331271 RepID=A0A0H2XLT1_BURO1|nr:MULTISPECIES: hypothetical protein [Burkholderia cepacia complex]ABK07616.1 conserved hypothetical protein [Burkholderia cenocepacia HI2424]MBJ9879836.1 hypothetical protein [Burkholderia cenocepacia]MCA8419885.1 hypothetical protein [Burkholderia cenocepacia]MDN7959116.1 hypothetical protein [Burkholderia orbicola]PNO75890.1 hypothetical protein DK10_002670 [Burkholderia cenocepacia]
MTSDPANVPHPDALPNPRGGAVRAADAWLAAAADAFERCDDAAAPLSAAAAVLAEAGWLPAARFAGQLSATVPLLATEPTSAGWRAALRDFRAAVGRHNLRELACSPVLFQHFRALRAQSAADLRTSAPLDALALVGRAVPPATLRALPDAFAIRIRARYEQALLGVLRAEHGAPGAALDELDAMLAALTDDGPYDFWRLAAACVRALRASGAPELKRFLARTNLLLGEHAQGRRSAPPELVRETVALLWRDFALFGAAAEDVALVDVLHDYGLTVDWHVAGTPASEALWEADAARAEHEAVTAAPTRALGVVTVNAHAYEDFLQTADASMADLAANPAAADPGAAWHASAAAYRVGTAACALGLGHAALLADTLGLAWRRAAHGVPLADGGLDAHRHASDMLRAALLKIAAGVAPPDLTAASEALGTALGRT